MIRISVILSALSAEFISKSKSSDFLSPRNNNGYFEEMKAGNLEREYVEEVCTYRELTETEIYKRSDYEARNEIYQRWNTGHLSK